MKRPLETNLNSKFSSILLKWNREKNRREMPWKGEKDPYKIWLSEIILQQTRVDQGLDYYMKFVNTFPDIHKLASAPEQQVFKLWEGLGYYTRCRNLIASAKYISSELGGKFPGNYDAIKKLKGVGPYTAAAISSFAFNLPHAVVDGNVYRVLARIFGIRVPVDSVQGKKLFNELAEKLLDRKQPGLYNQALMDFGATICKPLPECDVCPFAKHCVAYSQNLVSILPVKEKKITVRKRWFYYLQMEYRDMVMIRQRTGKDIWQMLFEFPMIETESALTTDHILKKLEKMGLLNPSEYRLISVSELFRQKLSHQIIAGQFIRVKIQKMYKGADDWQAVKKSQLRNYPFPRFLNKYLEASEISQSLL